MALNGRLFVNTHPAVSHHLRSVSRSRINSYSNEETGRHADSVMDMWIVTCMPPRWLHQGRYPNRDMFHVSRLRKCE
ncbi:hypothetical protein TNCV_4970141 [Trichonephila clavipes]|nr:hypothetical protein TNCV_4970141 [Trichonephila clavipes]